MGDNVNVLVPIDELEDEALCSRRCWRSTERIAVDDGWIRRGFLHVREDSRCEQVVVDRRVFDENSVDDVDDSIFRFVWRSQEKWRSSARYSEKTQSVLVDSHTIAPGWTSWGF